MINYEKYYSKCKIIGVELCKVHKNVYNENSKVKNMQKHT